MKILLIDDDEELCSELKEVLTAEGFEVDASFDGLHGLSLLRQKKYHMIILDLRLPGLNGYKVLKSIRSEFKELKVLVLSGRPLGEPILQEDGVSQDEEEKTLHLADGVVNKPCRVDALLEKIKALSVVDKG